VWNPYKQKRIKHLTMTLTRTRAHNGTGIELQHKKYVTTMTTV